MKKKCYISFTAVALIIMFTAMFMPHHHHHGLVCTSVTHSHINDMCSDGHSGSCNDDGNCIEDSDYIISKSNLEDNDFPTSLLPLFVIIENTFHLSEICHDNTHDKTLYRQSLYKSADVLAINTLRGPPSL